MLILVIALVALIVLGGAGVGSYIYFSSNKAEAASGEIEKHHDAKKVAKKNKAKTEIDKTKFQYVKLDPLILPIIDNNGVSQTVSMLISLEVVDDKVAGDVQAIAPRIKNAFIQDMYGVLNRHAALKGGVIQVDTIKERLNKISAKIIGEDKVHDIVLQVVQQRPV